MEPDDVMDRITAAVELGHGGEQDRAAEALHDLWTEIGSDGDALHRCGIAHALADLQPDPADELRWDLRALGAAAEITDERTAQAGMESSATGLFPSLHLNVGEAYRKLGDVDAARRHLALGLVAVDDLQDDGYGAMIRRGLNGLQDRLEQTSR